MTISKFLMNVAVCAVSIGGISTAYGADLDDTDERTPVRGPGHESASNSQYASLERLRPDDDNRSEAGSVRSTTSIINADPQLIREMDSLIEQLLQVPVTVTFPNYAEGKTPEFKGGTKLPSIRYALGNLVTAYKDLATVATDQATEIDRLKAILEELKTTDSSQADEVVNPQNVESSKWSYVAGGMVVGAAAVVATKLIVGSWPSIAAQFFRR